MSFACRVRRHCPACVVIGYMIVPCRWEGATGWVEAVVVVALVELWAPSGWVLSLTVGVVLRCTVVSTTGRDKGDDVLSLF